MGTALAVQPFNQLPGQVSKTCPKVLMNMNNTKETGGYDFIEKKQCKLFICGKCDETVA
jgi:NAD-dependent SIR2 family protein deacetylase